MMYKRLWQHALVSMALILLWGCRRPAGEDCHVAISPATDGLRFRILDSNGADLLIVPPPQGFNKDSLTCVQPCYAITPVAEFQVYPVPGGGQACVFSFPDLRTPALDEAQGCYSLYLRWNAADEDTVQWHYHTEQSGGCTLPVLDFLTFNGYPVQKADVGTLSYWALRK